MGAPKDVIYRMGAVDKLFVDLFSPFISDEPAYGPFLMLTNTPIDADFGRKIVDVCFATLCPRLNLPEGTEDDESELLTSGNQNREMVKAALEASIREVVGWWLGQNFTVSVIHDLCWRVAAGAKYILSGNRLLRSFCTVPRHWAPMRIEDSCYAGTSKNNKLMLDVLFRIYDGPFAGLQFQQRVPYKFFTTKMAIDIGFPLWKRKHKNDLGQAHFLGFLNTERAAYPRIDEFDASDGMRAHNAKLYRERARPCPRNFKWPCRDCYAGFLPRDLRLPSSSYCERATHYMAFIEEHCPKCGENRPYDPAFKQINCLGCQLKAVSFYLKRASYR